MKTILASHWTLLSQLLLSPSWPVLRLRVTATVLANSRMVPHPLSKLSWTTSSTRSCIFDRTHYEPTMSRQYVTVNNCRCTVSRPVIDLDWNRLFHTGHHFYISFSSTLFTLCYLNRCISVARIQNLLTLSIVSQFSIQLRNFRSLKLFWLNFSWV